MITPIVLSAPNLGESAIIPQMPTWSVVEVTRSSDPPVLLAAGQSYRLSYGITLHVNITGFAVDSGSNNQKYVSTTELPLSIAGLEIRRRAVIIPNS